MGQTWAEFGNLDAGEWSTWPALQWGQRWMLIRPTRSEVRPAELMARVTSCVRADGGVHLHCDS